MSLMYEMVGYDRKTGKLAIAYDIPESRIATIKKIAGIRRTDDGLGSYPLSADQVGQIAAVVGTKLEKADNDFFLEPFDEAAARSRGGRAAAPRMTSAPLRR